MEEIVRLESEIAKLKERQREFEHVCQDAFRGIRKMQEALGSKLDIIEKGIIEVIERMPAPSGANLKS